MKKNTNSHSKEAQDMGDIKHVQIKGVEKIIRQKSSEASEASSSRRQDSDSSVWSDNIPVITISKTESTENILNEDKSEGVGAKSKESKFKPKIRCVLRKQSTEIDEDTIRYFNADLERNISEYKTVKELTGADDGSSSDTPHDSAPSPDLIDNIQPFIEPIGQEETTDKSSSDDTDHKDGSVETILSFKSNTVAEN